MGKPNKPRKGKGQDKGHGKGEERAKRRRKREAPRREPTPDPPADPMTEVLATYRDPTRGGFEDAWCGLEPTFQSEKSIKKWARYAAKGPAGEDAYFEDDYMLDTQREVARAIVRRYQALQEERAPAAMFARLDLQEEPDQWGVRRQTLEFRWPDRSLEDFEARWTLDPETFEWSIKPVPLRWLYEERFVDLLQRCMWDVPLARGLSASMAHGGGQFSLSAKTFLGGSLLADDIATKLNHPELATWTMDWPNCDDRSFRATRRRMGAFRDLIGHYWRGGFHPRANGPLTAENALLDRGFGPAHQPPQGLMDPQRGPLGDAREVFQTNFAFGRAVRLGAQAVHPGYWQAQNEKADGYRPDQIMRYSEGNLNRLQIAGEAHVKSGKLLHVERTPELDAPLEPAMLTTEASWENRGQMSRTSARDMVEAVLLDVHHALWLERHPGVRVVEELAQDMLLGDAEATIERHGGAALLRRLRREARQANLEASGGRIRSEWIEPETLFWAAWGLLPPQEQARVAHEAVSGFVQRVEQAAEHDPRSERRRDPMEWHRHRVHPLLWGALDEGRLASGDPVRRELLAWEAGRAVYLARRPIWSQSGSRPPWEA
mgnify:CR=1 FL=1